jgi:hypothetical protein
MNSGREKSKIKTLALDHGIEPVPPMPCLARLENAGGYAEEITFPTGESLVQQHLRARAAAPFDGWLALDALARKREVIVDPEAGP